MIKGFNTLSSLGVFWMRLLFIFLAAFLSACGNNDTSDLDSYIQSIKAKPKGAIEKLPEFKMPETYTYEPDVLRDPFKPINEPDPQQDAGNYAGGLRPDFHRRKEELEAFPLDALKMVGTVVMNAKLWGLVKATDKTIHRVQVGNYMGKNFGKIIQISPDKIELIEIVPDRPGTWREQQTTLALAE